MATVGFAAHRPVYMLLSTSAPKSRFVSDATHELIHVLGRFHEHSRQDRDRYIRMQWANINPGIGVRVFKIGAIKCTCTTVSIVYVIVIPCLLRNYRE